MLHVRQVHNRMEERSSDTSKNVMAKKSEYDKCEQIIERKWKDGRWKKPAETDPAEHPCSSAESNAAEHPGSSAAPSADVAHFIALCTAPCADIDTKVWAFFPHGMHQTRASVKETPGIPKSKRSRNRIGRSGSERTRKLRQDKETHST